MQNAEDKIGVMYAFYRDYEKRDWKGLQVPCLIVSYTEDMRCCFGGDCSCYHPIEAKGAQGV